MWPEDSLADREKGRRVRILPNPNFYLPGNRTRLKMVLPIGKRKAWNLIATTDGLASWFPQDCRGVMEPGGMLTFRWREGIEERFRVIYLGEKHSSFRMEWRNEAQVQVYLHGRMTTLTLEVEYPKRRIGRQDQIRELPQWVFYLANLKSVGLGGPDLRHDLKGRTAEKGFID